VLGLSSRKIFLIGAILFFSLLVSGLSTVLAGTGNLKSENILPHKKILLPEISSFYPVSKFAIKTLELSSQKPDPSGKLFNTNTQSGKFEINVNLISNTTFPIPQGINVTSKEGNNLVAKMTLDQLNQNSTFESLSQVQVKIPVLVLFKNHNPGQHKSLIQSKGGDVKTSFSGVDAVAVKLTRNAIENLRNDPTVASIDPDIMVQALDISSDTQVRADKVWTTNDTGQGVAVAILDTGIDTTHPEFTGRIGLCHSEITNTNTCEDGNGHGTHVAGIVGASGVNPSAKGVAPSSILFSDQVLDSTGSGPLSNIIAGIDWARTNNAKVISMSLGTGPISTNQTDCDTAIPSLTTAINNAVAAGITVVAAAGNSGTSGVGAPGCVSSTIAVAAVDNTNTIASFSSEGGPLQDHGLSAPGVSIFSSYLSGGYAILS
jgi:minor extracellular protease Epr